MAATNTLVVQYYLAIERYPIWVGIFPSFVQYALIIIAIGVPLLVIIGYAHWKKTAARKAEVDIFYEVNPYIMRAIVNTELMLKLNLKLSKLLVKSQKNETLSDDEIKETLFVKVFSPESEYDHKAVRFAKGPLSSTSASSIKQSKFGQIDYHYF